jgi:hypothetical protein
MSNIAIRVTLLEIEIRHLMSILLNSSKIDNAKLNDKIHTKEILVIIFIFKK